MIRHHLEGNRADTGVNVTLGLLADSNSAACSLQGRLQPVELLVAEETVITNNKRKIATA